jgi:hypothetical protein
MYCALWLPVTSGGDTFCEVIKRNLLPCFMTSMAAYDVASIIRQAPQQLPAKSLTRI